MTGDGRRPHRPALFADLTEMIDAAGGDASPSARAEIAAATAAAVVQAGRAPLGGDGADEGGAAQGQDVFVALADRVGLDTLAELWRDSDPVSLPGSLWTLYVLRQWCHGSSDEVALLWRAGEPLAPADAVVAGLPAYAGADAVSEYADAVLAGIYQRDLAVALERAAAFFRVIAVGRRSLADGEAQGGDEGARDLAARNERAATALAAAARQWRNGTLH